jgi:hypothetical protein
VLPTPIAAKPWSCKLPTVAGSVSPPTLVEAEVEEWPSDEREKQSGPTTQEETEKWKGDQQSDDCSFKHHPKYRRAHAASSVMLNFVGQES